MSARRATVDKISTLDQAVESLYRLHVGVVGKGAGRHERPHKPVLLLAALDLIAQGIATPDRVPWSQELRSRFKDYFAIVARQDDDPSPENPFLYLRKDGWWRPHRALAQGEVPLEGVPSVADAIAGTVSATLTEPILSAVIAPLDRLRLREALIARFFPHARPLVQELFLEAVALDVRTERRIQTEDNDDAEERPGRSSGFRRTVQEIYNYQCAACGLRIKLPQLPDVTFVDAAHLIPFSDPEGGYNDHPTNGIALCKNHHWAMDRDLIAPCPDHRWRVRAGLAAHRSSGEKDLLELEGRTLLLPHDRAFHPSEAALAWRAARLVA